MSAAPGGIGVKAHPQQGTAGPLDRLSLPRRVLERTGRRCVIEAHHLYGGLAAGATAGIDDWLDALHGARREARGEIEVLWESCTALERRVLKLVTDTNVGLSSREADVRFGVSKGGSVQVAVDRLVAEGHFLQDGGTRTGWRVVDPFLAAWLRDDYG